MDALELAYVTYLNYSRGVQRYCKYIADQSFPAGLNTPSEVADSVAEMRLSLDNASGLLATAVGIIGSGLTGRDSVTHKVIYLRLSGAQRDAILGVMVDAFGQEVATMRRDSLRNLSTPFATVAAGLYTVLADPGWVLVAPR